MPASGPMEEIVSEKPLDRVSVIANTCQPSSRVVMAKVKKKTQDKDNRTATLLGALEILASALEVVVRAHVDVGDGLGRRLGDELVELPWSDGVASGGVTSFDHAGCFRFGVDWAGGAHGGDGTEDEDCGFGVHVELDGLIV